MKKYKADVVIAGGGLASIVTAYELLNEGKSVVLLERGKEENFGGLAKESFGGMFFVNSKQQQRAGMKDSPELALRDWHSVADFSETDVLPKKWAEQYVNTCTDQVQNWLTSHGVKYFPIVHWVERGRHQPGNALPRFHMVWGTGHGLVTTMISHLLNHPRSAELLQVYFDHRCEEITVEGGRASGIVGASEIDGTGFLAEGENVVIGTGGMGGSIERVKENWYKPWGSPPSRILNGCHPFCDGTMHDAVAKLNGNLTHLDHHWHYAAGVHHPRPRWKDHGLSLVPPKSALWLDHTGKRFGPDPLVTAYDTRWLVEEICDQEKKYSWQILNMKIMNKEFAISGSEFNEAIRDKNLVGFLKSILFGNKKLVNDMLTNCPDFVVANSIEELVQKMNALEGSSDVSLAHVKDAVVQYDANIKRGPKLHNDGQLTRIAHARQYRGDKVRTCNFQPIIDDKAMPLIAIREFILSRKTLGGIQTDLNSQVLTRPQNGVSDPIPGLYAVGEAAGFGGGGVHGKGALEGTFLGGCVLTGRVAAKAICDKKLV